MQGYKKSNERLTRSEEHVTMEEIRQSVDIKNNGCFTKNEQRLVLLIVKYYKRLIEIKEEFNLGVI